MKKRLVKKLAKQAIEVYEKSDDVNKPIRPEKLRRALATHLIKRAGKKDKIVEGFWKEFDRKFEKKK
ncbi:hypothetical protein K7T73_12660 [Bacillus badius]|uniref:hypothetical protein n=1 Tax=Bacillus badius TaxID=1455 RepID=UPI001CC1C0CD|nr:hypothetical protein [Bacillus badius]UAT29451.1 hypothetical protein K7T73_12660 [Bacillus badius]